MALNLAEVITGHLVDLDDFFGLNRELAAFGEKGQDRGAVQVTIRDNANPYDVDPGLVADRTGPAITNHRTPAHNRIKGIGQNLDPSAVDHIVGAPTDTKYAFGGEPP